MPTVSPGNRKSGKKLLSLGALVALGLGAVVVVRSVHAVGGGTLTSYDSVVETVRGGVLADYNTTTVGKAFEGTFQNAKWSALETSKGATVVQFDGTIKANKIKAELTDMAQIQKIHDDLQNACIASEVLTDRVAKLKSDTAASLQAYNATLADYTKRFNLAYNEQTRPSTPFAGKEWSEIGPVFNAERTELDKTYADQEALIKHQEDELSAIIVKCIASKADDVEIPVKFQFTISAADKKTFKLSYVDNAFGNDPDRALPFIYK
jgi:hypothetical protein